MAVGDFNNDGKTDVAIACVTAFNQVWVFMNTTPAGTLMPTFSSGTIFSTGSYPIAVAVADFDGDGKPDLVVADRDAASVSILRNTTANGATTPSFAAKLDLTVSSNPFGVTVSDFNKDGKPDLVVGNTNLNANVISVLLNTTTAGSGTITFSSKQDFGTGLLPRSVGVGDFDADGKMDLAVGNDGSGSISVLLNTTPNGAGTATFSPKQDFVCGGEPYAVAVADYNGDSKPDLAIADWTGNAVSVILNTTVGTGAVTFTPKQAFATGSSPYCVAAGDFNNDGRPDLATANEAGTVSVLLNTTPTGAGTPSFAGASDYSANSGATSTRWVAIGDFNSDGNADLAAANYASGTAVVFPNCAVATGTILNDDPTPTVQFTAASQRRLRALAP